MNKFEAKFGHDLDTALVRYGAVSRIMHGSAYQPGIPDRLIIDRRMGFTFVELKIDECERETTRVIAVGMLRPQQIITFNEMWARQTRAFIAVRHTQSMRIYLYSWNAEHRFDNLNLLAGHLLTCSI